MLTIAVIASGGFLASCGDPGASSPDLPDGRIPGDAAGDADVIDGSATDARVLPELQVDRVEDLGAMPLPSAITTYRDGGQSGVLGGKSLWTFGDTFVAASWPTDNTSVLSATGAWSWPATPFLLEQPVDADGFPAQLIPYTETEIAANRLDARNGVALWPGVLLDTGTPDGLLTFLRMKRINGRNFETQGVGTARIAVDATVATRDPEDLFTAPELMFQPLQVLGEHVYAFACHNADLTERIGCKLARAPKATADQRAAYQFFDGSSWVNDMAAAVVVFDKYGGAPTISWNPYLGRYLAVGGAWVTSTVLLRTADRIEGPWSDPVEIPAGDPGLLPPEEGRFSYIIVDHPELASADGRSIVISYSRPTGFLRGDVRLARVTFR